MAAVQHVELQLDGRQPVVKFGVLAGERLLVDIAGEPRVEQPVLLLDEQRFLTLEFTALSK